MAKDVSALAGTLTAPATTGGTGGPVVSATNEPLRTENVAASKTVGDNGSPAAKETLRLSVAIVIVALVFLWFLGGIVFKNANL